MRARFIKTACHPKDYPVLKNASGHFLPEVAVLGRSNVGKSSLLNHFFHAKNLVKVSSTPGKTQTIQFFTYEEKWAFADLPGYGYAKVPGGIRSSWKEMVESYLNERSSLASVLLLLDIRHLPNEQDQALYEWLLYHRKPTLIVLTKTDKLSPHQLAEQQARIIDTLQPKKPSPANGFPSILYSVPKNQGYRELLFYLNQTLSHPPLHL